MRGVAFHNSGHRLALGHVNDMRCLEKVHAFLFVRFDSLHHINNLSDIRRRVYLGWTSAKLGLMGLAQGHNVVTPVNPEPTALGLESSTLPLSHCTSKLQRKTPIWNYEIPQIYLLRCQSFIYGVRMHLDRYFCVLFRFKGPTIHVSSWLIWPCHSQILTKAPKRLFFRKFFWRWHDDGTLILSLLLELLYAVT